MRQSPFKILTALVNFTMMMDELEATRLGTSPWYYLAIDTLGFLAALAASTGYIRSVTREKEYSEGLAEEAARNQRKQARWHAETRLAEATAPALLEVDCTEVDAAVAEGEGAEVAAPTALTCLRPLPLLCIV